MTSLLQKINDLNVRVDNVSTSGGTTDTTALQAQVDTNTTDISGIQTNKQNTLIAGDNITITGDTISSSGGGGTTIDSTTDINCNTLTTAGDLNVGGKIIAPNRVHFRARRASNLTVSAPGAIPYTDVRFNLGGSSISQYTGGIFTARTAGKYFFFANFFTIPDVYFVVDIYHFNSARNRVSAGRQQGITSTQEVRYITATIDLDDGWDVRVRVEVGSVFVGDGTSNGSANRDYTSFGGFLIG